MHRILLLSLFATTFTFAETIDRSGKWDVNGPLGQSSTLEFTTNEGTWMNVDVHPDGDKIIFDLLGDLYVVSIDGGEAARLTDGAAIDIHARFSPDGSQVLFTSDRGGNSNAWTAAFDGEELSDFKVVTEQNGNMINGGDWMADGEWVLARKRVTDTSSIGISELWMFHKDGGKGVQLIADKGELDSFSATTDGRYIYLGTSGPFSYGRNPHGRVWSVTRYDRKTGEKRPVTGGNGSAAAPALSPDGQSIAFVRRVGVQSTLWIHELKDGSERQIWDGLDRDQIEGFGTNYIYPGYDWTPDGQSLIVWAGGKINRVASDGSGATIIPFEADVSLRYREPLRSTRDPAPDTVQAKLIRWPVISPDGNTLVFNAFGYLYYKSLPDGTSQRVTNGDEFEFAPSFSPDGSELAYTTWDDAKGGTLRTISMRHGNPGSASTVFESRTQLVNPAYSADGKHLLVVTGSGANLRGQLLGAEQRHDIVIVSANGRGESQLVTSTTNRGAQIRVTRPTFSQDGKRIWFFDSEAVEGERGSRVPAKTVLLSIKLDGTDRKTHMSFLSIKLDGTDRKTHMSFRYAQEAMVSPDETRVAFTELHNTYVTALPKAGAAVEFDPSGAAFAFQKLSQDGGEWVTWSNDGQHLSWSFGRKIYRAATADLAYAAKAEPNDSGDHGIDVIAITVTDGGQYIHADASYDLDALKPVLESNWQDSVHARVDVTLNDDAPFGAWTALNKWLGESKVEVKQTGGDEAEDDDEHGRRSGHRGRHCRC